MDKADIRVQMGALEPVDTLTSNLVSRGLRDWLSTRIPGTIGCYLAMAHEVDFSPLFESLPGWRWVLIRVEDDNSTTFRDRDVPRETQRFGMRQPIDSGEVVPDNQIDVYLVPGVAFDETGGRLGHGGGFYDRVLSRCRRDALTVGVTTRSRVIESVPMGAHDIRVRFLATEDGVRDCSANR